jgi:hypothetical protein
MSSSCLAHARGHEVRTTGRFHAIHSFVLVRSTATPHGPADTDSSMHKVKALNRHVVLSTAPPHPRLPNQVRWACRSQLYGRRGV